MSVTHPNEGDPPLEKDPVLWYEDADVIFKVGRRLFRVHRTILAEQSTHFKNLFSLPFARDQGRYENCVVIDLPGTRVWEAHNLFRSLLDPAYLDYILKPEFTNFETLVRMLKVADQYGVSILFGKIVRRLEVMFHPSFVPSAILLTEVRKIYEHEVQPQATVLLILIRLVDLVHLEWLIPQIYYFCSFIPLAFFLNSSMWAEIEPQRKDVFLNRREQVIFQRNCATAWMIAIPVPNCQQKNACGSAQMSIIGGRNEDIFLIAPLTRTYLWINYIKHTKLCGVCRDAAHRMAQEFETDCWDAIMQGLNIGTWEELKEKRRQFYQDPVAE